MKRAAWAGVGAFLLAAGMAGWLLRPHRAPGNRHVVGFVVPWDPDSRVSLERHAGSLTEVALPAFSISGRGEPLYTAREDLLRTAQRTGLPVQAVVTNFTTRFDAALAHRVCASPASRRRFAAALVDQARAHGFSGLNLDFEDLAAADAPAYVSLLETVRSYCRPQGMLLSVDVPAARDARRDDGFDLKGLGRTADLVIGMLYDEHGPQSKPGPIASSAWADRNLDEMLASVPASKLVIGVGTYGYDWSHGPAQEISFPRALSAATQASASIDWDSEARAPHFSYSANGERHQVWLEDAGSVSGRVSDALSHRCAGIGVWRLGDEDPDLWRVADAYRDGHPAGITSSVMELPSITVAAGAGDLYTLAHGDTRVYRRSRWAGGEVVEEDYPDLKPSFALERYLPVKPKMVALTFDDGPDPENTPRLLDELKAAHAPATFFLIGQSVAEHPEIVARAYAEGHDLGSHTYSHPHMEQLSPFQAKLEVNLNQRLIESVTGHRTVLFRRPYDVNNNPRDDDEVNPLLAAADAGYLMCGASIDPADWDTKSADQIVNRCLRELDRNAESEGHVIVMHDGGGNRDATVAAVPRLIRELRRRGYQLVSLHELVGRPREMVMAPAGAEPWITRAGLLVVRDLVRVDSIGRWFMLGGVLFMLLRLIFTSAGALQQFRKTRRLPQPDFSGGEPLVSVLVPAYNEGEVIRKTIHSLLASRYRNLEILVIDDGSKDNTYECAVSATDDPRVRVFQKENDGKGQALNYGLLRARGEYVVAIDADTLFEPDTIPYLVNRLLDPKVGAVAGNIKVGNRSSMLTRWQHLEYVVGINLDKRFFDLLGCVPVVPGAVGAWRKEAILEAGGYSRATMAEDADLTLSVQRAGWKVVYEDRAVAWTEAPTSWSCLYKQRLRWTFGTLQCLWKHREAFFNPKAGTLGMIGLPYIAFYHLLLLAGPLVDGALLIGFLAGWWKVMLLLSLPYLASELAMAALAFRMDGEPVWTIWPLLLQRFGYRQVIYYTMFRAVSMAVKGTHLAWQKPRRLATLELPVTEPAGS